MTNSKTIFINYAPWQTRIAILLDDKLQNLYFDSHTTTSLERCFFKGVPTKILPGIQTAFVDIGQERAGFLHISEIDRDLALKKIEHTVGDDDFEDEEREKDKRDKEHRKQIDIRNILREKEPVLVQVNKEPVGTKGAKLSTCFTLPGRFVVLMPNIPRIGISKKIENAEERKRLRDLVRQQLPEGMGAIIRTTSENQGERAIVQDITYLIKAWETIQKRFKEAQPGEQIHRDIDLCLQIVRDHLDSSVEMIVCDDQSTFDSIYSFVKNVAPDDIFKVKLYQKPERLFDTYHIEEQIREALDRKVFLSSGGSIVIEATEAMTVIDVNTGRFLGGTNLEETILSTNLEASEEIVRQLRLRNIGGLIVIDFIDMAMTSNQQKLYKTFDRMLRERDKFQSVVLKISEFGLVQMTRKRSGKTLMHQIMSTCACCAGLGMINSLKTEAYNLLRGMEYALVKRAACKKIVATVSASILEYLTTIEYNSIIALEKRFNCQIMFVAVPHVKDGVFSFSCE
jgi:ribonuclease G